MGLCSPYHYLILEYFHSCPKNLMPVSSLPTPAPSPPASKQPQSPFCLHASVCSGCFTYQYMGSFFALLHFQLPLYLFICSLPSSHSFHKYHLKFCSGLSVLLETVGGDEQAFKSLYF